MAETNQAKLSDIDIEEDIARRITYWRTQANMKPAELARRLGITRGAVSQWELGRKPPGIRTVYRIAEICGVSLAIFLTADIPS